MNSIHFERWWEDSRIQSPHHKLKKSTNSRLVTKKGVDFQRKYTIPILLQKSKQIKIEKNYRLQEITERFCQMYGRDIKILRLPDGHSELSSIELLWAQVKSEVARKNTTFKIVDVKCLMNNALQGATRLNWPKKP